MPLRSALRRLLEPHGLKAVVADEGLLITPDFTEWTRRGVATDYWVHQTSETNEWARAALEQTVKVDFHQVPLRDAVNYLGEMVNVATLTDRLALKEIDIDDQIPISLKRDEVSLRSVLNSLLGDLDLTYMVRNGTLHITTKDAAKEKPLTRIYFLEGTGLHASDFSGISMLVQTMVASDTWSIAGGDIAPLNTARPNRPGIVVSTTFINHEQIARLFAAIRHSQVGPDPID
jgi:hypothetical protein